MLKLIKRLFAHDADQSEQAIFERHVIERAKRCNYDAEELAFQLAAFDKPAQRMRVIHATRL